MDDKDKQGIAIREQVFSCSSNSLITEEAEHLDYRVKANFYKEGIRLTQLSRYFIADGALLIQDEEIDPLLSIFNIWEKQHKSLPGSRSCGHSWCGWISTDYFAAGSDKPAFTEHNPKSPADSVRKKSSNNNPKRVVEWKTEQEKAEEQLNETLEDKLSTKTLEAKISRFELELKYKGKDAKENKNIGALLTEYDIAAIRDFVPLYRKRRSQYI